VANLRTPYTQQWNFTVERQLGGFAIRLPYVGTHSVDLIYTRSLYQSMPSLIPFHQNRRPHPPFNTITYYDNGAGQRYNGLQATVAKNYRNGLTFDGGCTWAKDLTDAQDTGGFSGHTIETRFNLNNDPSNTNILSGPAAFAITGYPFSTPVCTNPVAIGRNGDAGLGIIRGPNISNANFLGFQLFPHLRVAANGIPSDFCKCFQHPNFTLPTNISARATVPQITSTTPATFGAGGSAGDRFPIGRGVSRRMSCPI
jgi:hypothetical protein